MSHDQKATSKSGRLSVFFHRSEPRSPQIDRYLTLYPFMLIEDVHHNVMPYSRFTDNSPFRAEAVPGDSKMEQFIAEGISPRNGYRRDLGEIVSDFFREVVQRVLVHSMVGYEIVVGTCESNQPAEYEESTVKDSRNFTFAKIPDGSFHVSGECVHQKIPEEIAEVRHIPTTIQIPLSKVVIFELPKADGRAVFRALDRLAEVSDHPSNSKAMFLETGEWNSKFDFETYHRNRSLAIADATRDIGWNARGLLDGFFTEYYQVWRQLIYEELLIRIRDAFLETINLGLSIAGKQMGFSTRLVLHGLPSIDDVKAARNDLEVGNTSFKDIWERFSI